MPRKRVVGDRKAPRLRIGTFPVTIACRRPKLWVLVALDQVMIHKAKDLSPDQKTVLESLLGRRILEDEAISVRAIEPVVDQN